MAVTWPDHLLTLREWIALPPDSGHHVELVDGALLVTPRPAALHQRAMTRLATSIEDQLPSGLSTVADAEVVITPRDLDDAASSIVPATVRVPDVVIVRSALLADNPARLPAAEVLLAVEIISPGTRTTDRVTKLVEYADAGIPAYWLIDLDPPTPSMTAYLLVNGDYEVVADGSGLVELDNPFALRVRLDELIRLH